MRIFFDVNEDKSNNNILQAQMDHYLDKTEEIINLVEGNSLNKEDIFSMQNLNNFKEFDFNLGGSQTLFVLFCTIEAMEEYNLAIKIFKPKIQVESLIHHIVTVYWFNKQKEIHNIKLDEINYSIKPLRNFGVATFNYNVGKTSFVVPILIQEKSIIPKNYFNVRISKIARTLAYDGFTVDMMMSNWRQKDLSEKESILEYFDLMMFNKSSPGFKMELNSLKAKMDKF